MSGKYWTASWNPIIGCEKCSPGCERCWAESTIRRLVANGALGPTEIHYQLFSKIADAGWSGEHALIERWLNKPLHWRKPRTVAVNWLGDMWRREVPVEWKDRVMAMILASATLTNLSGSQFLLLTKQAEAMAEYFSADATELVTRWAKAGDYHICLDNPDVFFSEYIHGRQEKPPVDNTWHGASVCNQTEADKNIPTLQGIRGKRWLSIEPMLSGIDLIGEPEFCCSGHECGCRGLPIEPSLLCGISWVVVGSETGPGARPCDPAWVQSIAVQCAVAGVPCWVKQAPGGLDRGEVTRPWPREKPAGMP